MALADKQQQFFNHVLAKDHATTLARIPLLVNDHHVEFDIQLYSIKAMINGVGSAVHLKSSTNSMMKCLGLPSVPTEVLVSQKMVAGFIDSYYEKVTGLAVNVPVSDIPVAGKSMKFMDPTKLMPDAKLKIVQPWTMADVGEKPTKGIAAAVDGENGGTVATGGQQAGKSTAVHIGKTLAGGMDLEQAAAVAKSAEKHESVSKQPACKPGVVKLADAEALGQRVYGTNEGSIYRLIAANQRVKVAARVKGHQLSIRVEVKAALVPEIINIKNSGVTWHEQGYGSLHLGCNGMPVSKVLGAYLYGLGIHFDRVLAPGEEVPV